MNVMSRFGAFTARSRFMLLLAVVALVTACGGGGGGGDPAPDPVPVPVPVAPTISSQPASQSVQAGQTATFSVVAAGDAPLAYQWLRDGGPIAGAVQSSYALVSPTIADNNSRFAVRVSNAAGTVTSVDAVLTVIPKPVVTAVGISLLAGTPGGTGNVDGTGTLAYFAVPQSLTFDAAGNLYIADEKTIRMATPAGRVTTVAGGFAPPNEQRDGTGDQARFSQARAIAAAPDGTFYIADGTSIRRMTVAGAVSTVANAASSLVAVAVAPNGNVYFASRTAVYRLVPGSPAAIFAGQEAGSGGGPPVTQVVNGTGTAATFAEISDLAIDAAGNVHVSELFVGNIRKITPGAVVTTLARIRTQTATGFDMPDGMAFDPAGNLWVFELSAGVMNKVAPDGSVTTPFGSNPLTAPGSLSQADGDLAFSPSGELYFAYRTGISRLTPEGAKVPFVGTVAPTTSEGGGKIAGLQVDAAGNVVTASYERGEQGTRLVLRKVSPDGTAQPTLRASTKFVGNNVYEYPDNSFGGFGLDAQGAAYTAYISWKPASLSDFPAGGGISKTSATGEVTELVSWAIDSPNATAPVHLALGPDGSLYFVDVLRSNLVKWTASGGVTVVAPLPGSSGFVGGLAKLSLAVDASGRVSLLQGSALYRLTDSGFVLLAGSPTEQGAQDGAGAAARFQVATRPYMSADAAGNLFIADGELIRKVTVAGVVSTVAGQTGRFGTQPGPLPGSLGGVPGPLDVGPDGALYTASSGALFKINLP